MRFLLLWHCRHFRGMMLRMLFLQLPYFLFFNLLCFLCLFFLFFFYLFFELLFRLFCKFSFFYCLFPLLYFFFLLFNLWFFFRSINNLDKNFAFVIFYCIYFNFMRRVFRAVIPNAQVQVFANRN